VGCQECEFHDLTAGSVYAVGAEVACHNDLDPRNTVYRASGAGLVPIALIDWDIAGPGDRVHDLAHMCWTYTRLGPGADVAVIEHRLDVAMGAYRWDGSAAEVVDAMLWWQDRCWRGIVAEADAGDDAMRALVGNGIVDAVKSDYSWTKENLRHSA
jgi:aminoglycoside phosphotransferase (APT) family kinase protein